MKRSIGDITRICQKYLTQKDLEKIQKAFEFAQKAHQGQYRRNKDEFIQHSLHTALTLAQMGLDAETISGGLLHDTVEDAQINPKEIEKNFGHQISNLVWGITRVGKVRLKKEWANQELIDQKLDDRTKNQIENLRKMFVAMAKDVRVVLIKLADRLHNMETLYALPAQKAKRIATETLEIYAPLAHRLGIGEIKGKLEDLAFIYVLPAEYRRIKSLVGEKDQERKTYIKKVIKAIKKILKSEEIEVLDIDGRAKHLYSLYKKLKKHDNDISKIYDLMAVRMIASNASDCYKILGIIHEKYKPLPGYIKDYISMPKPNGYQSLHTTIFCLDGRICEIQIRTKKMHEHAEYGVAAHWHYTNKIGPKKDIEQKGIFAPKKDLGWISDLARWQEKLKSPTEFKNAIKLDFFSDRIFAFTPQGDVKNLPVGACPIDFAYSIHTEVGGHCQGARINGKMVSLDYELKNGDMVEIIKAKRAHPRQDWLKLIKTAEARSKIRGYLRKKEVI